MPDKACRNCKRIIEKGDVCPVCGGTDLTTNWKGFVIVFTPADSLIAKQIGATQPGKYALRLSR
jgi:DNA-directed RNA polymerase subunit E"